ncbi:MAG: hypothetical protein F3745_10015 [Nitrospinae bacterium]|nr:hypothetical protein [Nitrospinota bacterium]
MWKYFLLLVIGSSFLSAEEGVEELTIVKNKFCVRCHKEENKSYLKSPHGDKKKEKSPANDHECQSCHGPGSEHTMAMGDEPMPVGQRSKLDPRQQEAFCMKCHKGTELLKEWTKSVHFKQKNTCIDCHNVHRGFPKGLREATEEKLCASCHKDLKLTEKHFKGVKKCSKCHNPHKN